VISVLRNAPSYSSGIEYRVGSLRDSGGESIAVSQKYVSCMVLERCLCQRTIQCRKWARIEFVGTT
jgi:hypothetical protein